MATKLRNLQLTSVDLVRAGANQEADICLYKSLDGAPQTEARTISKSDPDRFDTIHEVQKFNPFHDERGRFSNKNGFSTYSANPKMRAAQPSIARSAQAGHGKTLNVHRESKGENINQNYDWMQGKPYGKPDPAPAKPTKQPKQSKPKQPDTDQKPEDAKPKGEPERKVVEGRDLVAELGAEKIKNLSTEEILRLQGFDNHPQVDTTDEAFGSTIKKNGNVGVRSWRAADEWTAAAYDDQLKNGDFYTKCEGGNALGRGMYVALSTESKNPGISGRRQGEIDYDGAMYASDAYGPWHVNMSIDKNAKVATISDLKAMAAKDGFKSETWSDYDTVNYDIGAYAAAKGFDGVIAHGKTGTIADNPDMTGMYLNMVNRSKVTIFDKSGMNNDGDLRHSTKGLTDMRGAINVNDIGEDVPLF